MRLPPWLCAGLCRTRDALYVWTARLCDCCDQQLEIAEHVVASDAYAMGLQRRCYSNRRAQERLGYRPDLPGYVSREASVEQTLHWARLYTGAA